MPSDEIIKATQHQGYLDDPVYINLVEIVMK
jgi:hypothetical protein